jgi:hypothetical protein
MVLEVKPLADTQGWSVFGELIRRRLGTPVLPEETQIEVPVV